MNRLFALLMCMFGSFNCADASLPPISLLAPPEQHSLEAVTMYGEVDTALAGKVIAAIQAQNRIDTKEPIALFINSPGGDVLAGGMIIDAMMASRRPVVTVCVSLCASMAAMTFEFGAKRIMGPSAVVMFHECSMGVQGDLSHVHSRVEIVQRIVDRYERVIAKRVGISVEELQAHEAKQWWLLGDEAVKANVADSVALLPDYPAPTE